MDKLSIAIRDAIILSLKSNGMEPNDISNYNISRKAATKIFTIIMYKNTQTKKKEKRLAKLELDSEYSTLISALQVLDAMIEEASKKHFLQKNKALTKKDFIVTEDPAKGYGE